MGEHTDTQTGAFTDLGRRFLLCPALLELSGQPCGSSGAAAVGISKAPSEGENLGQPHPPNAHPCPPPPPPPGWAEDQSSSGLGKGRERVREI